MVIDGRLTDRNEVLSRLKAYFKDLGDKDAEAEVLVTDKSMIVKVRAFCKMSGFESEVRPAEGHYVVRIFGSSCRCG